MNSTRREFLAYGGAAAVGSTLAAGMGVGLAPSAVRAAAEAPAKRKFRVGMRTGSLGGAVKALAEAKRLSFDGIEIEAGGATDTLECANADLQKEFLAEVEKTGVVLSSICMGLMNGNPVFSEPRAKSWLE